MRKPLALGVALVTVVVTARATAGPLDLIGAWVPDRTLGLRAEAVLPLPADPRIVLAGTPSGVSRSTDGGDTWVPSSGGLPPGGVHALAVDGTRVLAGTESGVYGSGDGGTSWTAVALAGVVVRALAVQPGTPTVVLAGGSGGVYRDQGLGSWQRVLNAPTAFSVAMDPSLRLIAIAGTSDGVALSFDRGQTWTGSLLSGPAYAVAVSSAVPPVVYAGRSDGLYRSVAGLGWARASGLPNAPVRAIETQGTLVYAGGDQRAWASADAGGTFETYSTGISPGQSVLAFALDRENGTLFAGAATDAARGNVYRRSTIGSLAPGGLPPAPPIPPIPPLPPLPPVPPLPEPPGLPLPRTGWIPANTGVLWWQNDPNYPIGLPQQPVGEANRSYWITRRIAASPFVPELLHLGSFFHGVYASAGGGAWATLTPGCWLPVTTPAVLSSVSPAYQAFRRAAIQLTGLDACGIESIVYDPVFPNRLYASAYDVVSLTGYLAVLGDGGVFVSDNLGLSWRKLLGGIRGNALALHRDGARAATIAAGYIQTNGGGGSQVGPTPDNGSLSISRDDGASWTHIRLPSSGCPDIPDTSQRITPTIAINPTDPARMYAGTNAGLYDSNDGGRAWTYRMPLCRGVWGIAVTRDGSRIYVGDANGVVWTAPTATMSFSAVTDLGVGRIQSLLLDRRDGSDRTLYAAMWSGSDARVARINTTTGSVARLDDSVLRDVVPLDQGWPPGVPKPFPLTPRQADGTQPSLFLSQEPAVPGALFVSTLIRGVFVRID